MNNSTNASIGTNTGNANGIVNNNNTATTTNDDENSSGDTTTCLLDLLDVSNRMLKLQLRNSPDPFNGLLSPTTSAVGSSSSVFDNLFVPTTAGAPSSVFDSLFSQGGCNASRLRPRVNDIDEQDDISGGGNGMLICVRLLKCVL